MELNGMILILVSELFSIFRTNIITTFLINSNGYGFVVCNGKIFRSFSTIQNITNIVSQGENPLTYFNLSQNYPNPFNPVTTISYQIPQTSFVSLKVYDILGTEIAIIVNEEKPAGEFEVEFDGTGLASGIYFYKLQTRNYNSVKKMVLLK